MHSLTSYNIYLETYSYAWTESKLCLVIRKVYRLYITYIFILHQNKKSNSKKIILRYRFIYVYRQKPYIVVGLL